MIFGKTLAALAAISLLTPPLAAAPAVDRPDPEALFTSPDPRLNHNKQRVLKMLRELVNCGQWEKVDQFMTERYIQHNPLIKSGRAEVVSFSQDALKTSRVEKCGKLTWPVIAVVAEGDYVTVMLSVEYPVPLATSDSQPTGQVYKTTWFDTWRLEGDKMDEHWDGQKMCAPGVTARECVLSGMGSMGGGTESGVVTR